MCGRYRLSRRKQLVSEYFDAVQDEAEWHPRYNIAPSQPVPVVRQNPKKPVRELSLLRWGLIPSWATDTSIGFKTINARSETVTTAASFRDPIRTQRWLLPADGFYKWQRKQPYCFEVGDGELFAFAGSWDRWNDPHGEVVETCTILTTTPNDLLSNVHDRMPVILNPADYSAWLNLEIRDMSTALKLLVPFAGSMRRYPVSTQVNQVQNDDAECAKPIQLESHPPGRLF